MEIEVKTFEISLPQVSRTERHYNGDSPIGPVICNVNRQDSLNTKRQIVAEEEQRQEGSSQNHWEPQILGTWLKI